MVLLHPQVGEDLVELPLEALLVCEPPAWAMDLISVAILDTDLVRDDVVRHLFKANWKERRHETTMTRRLAATKIPVQTFVLPSSFSDTRNIFY